MRSKRFGWALAEWCVAWALVAGGVTCRGGWSAATANAFAQSAPASAIATTTVTDTIYTASGSPAAGTVLISWPAFVTAGGANIPAGETSVTLGANGLLSVALVPNSGSTPMGSYYTVIYHLADGTVTRQYWVVPALPAGGAAAVKVSAISTTVLPASVAMQTVSKSYVDQAIAAATTGAPLDSSPYVQKAGDTMTGPLVLPGDPVAPLQAAEKQYVDEQIAAVGGGVGQKVSEMPQATQVVAQPVGTDLAVNNLNGALYASQYVSGGGNNGIANAVASADCTSGCDVVAEHSYAATENVAASSLNPATRVEDRRNGRVASTSLNPLNTAMPGDNSATAMDLASTRSAASLYALNGAEEQFATTLKLTNEALAGGANVFPQNVQGATPYFKTTYSALSTNGTSNTPGQHILKPSYQVCYSVGDCLMGSDYMVTSGGLRDDADEGSHPYDLDYSEDTQVFTGTCTSGCTAGATLVNITPSAAAGTQGEGRYLLDTAPAKVISTGTLIGGSTGATQQIASFSGTSFPVSTFLQTAQAIPPQANNIAPGTVSVAIVSSGAPAGYASSTAALPAASGVACIAGQANQLNSIVDFETVPYTIVDGSHLSLTLTRPHENGATIAVGGLCGYGLEQKVDTTAGIRQVFPVIGSPSATTLFYAAGSTTIVGQSSTSGFINLNQVIAAIARNNNTVTITTVGNMAQDFSGLALTVQGVGDASYNGTFTVTATSAYTLTYTQSGANSSSSGGTVSYLTGGYALYPMAEVVNVFNASTKAIDGQMTLAANTVSWAAGDTVEQPHYFQQRVSADLQFVTQFTPRPALLQTAGIHYLGNNGTGLNGWEVANQTANSAYFGVGGTHQLPNAGMAVYGPWKTSLDLDAGTGAVLAVHCNLHGCGRWNSAYNLAQMDSNQGTDTIGYSPLTSALNFTLAGTGYSFTPQGFTANTINVTQLNANTINGVFSGSITASSLPVFGASGAAHAVGAVPDPGAAAGTSRYLREDGTWTAPAAGSGGSGANGVASLPQLAAVRLHGPLGGANLFNPSAATVGAFVNTSGARGTAGSYGSLTYSDYIPCNSGGTMATATALPALGGDNTVSFYDQSYTYLSGSTSAVSAGGTWTCLSNAAFVVLTINTSDLANEMVVNGSAVPSSYQAFTSYPSNVVDSKLAAVELTATTLAAQRMDALLAPYNLYNPATVTSGYLVQTGLGSGTCGSLTPFSGYVTSAAIPVLASTAYTLWSADGDNNNGYGLVWLDQNGNCTGTPVGFPFTAGQVVTSPATAYFVRFSYASQYLAAVGLTKGTTIPANVQPYPQLKTATEATVSALASVPWGVWGDSISSVFNSQWEIVVSGRTGMTQTFQDARPGRAFLTAFECYGTTTPGAALGTFSSSNANGNCSGYPVYFANGSSALLDGSNGNTLAQNLTASGIQVLVLRLGTNDENVTIGTLGDATSAGTLYGNMRWVIENLLKAAPQVRLLMVGPELNGEGQPSVIAAVDAAEEAIANVYALPYLSLLKTSGNSFLTNSLYTRDSSAGSPASPACTFGSSGVTGCSGLGTHPSDWAFQHIDGPTIAEFIKRFY